MQNIDVTGALYGVLGSYQLPFLLAGCPPIIGALIMLLIHRIKDDNCVKSIDRPSSLNRKENEPSDVTGDENPGFVHDSFTVVVSPHKYAGLLNDSTNSRKFINDVRIEKLEETFSF